MTTGTSIPTKPVQLMGSRRRLTPLQQKRRDRLFDAARRLAIEGGYCAVTMRDVAAMANVGLATVYRYFHSKDHLIAEINAETSLGIIDELTDRPPPGETPAARLTYVFHLMLESTVENLNVAAAGIQAIISEDPNAGVPDYWQQMIMVPYLRTALGENNSVNQQELGEILGHIFFSLMIGLCNQRLSLGHCKDVMAKSVALLLHEQDMLNQNTIDPPAQ